MENLSLVSQTLRSELEQVEKIMIAELEVTCSQYQQKYTEAVNLFKKNLSINATEQ